MKKFIEILLFAIIYAVTREIFREIFENKKRTDFDE